MSQEINKAEKQDLSLVVRAIGSDLEHTQVRMIASANADMLFHYWKVGAFYPLPPKETRLGKQSHR